MCLMKFLQFFIRVQNTIIKIGLKDNLNVLVKTTKSRNLFCSNKKVITKIDKKGNETVETVSYKMKFIDSIRFMERSLSNLVDNLTEGIYKIKYKDCNCFLEYESVKDNSMKYKCSSCNKNYSSNFDEELKKKFKNTFKFSNNYINKFILLFRKGIY